MTMETNQSSEVIDLCLKFDSEASAFAVLYERVGDENSGSDYKPRYNVSIDVVGVIYKPTGAMIQSDQGEVAEMTALDGWHVNVRGPRVPELEHYAVAVKSPVRVWL